MSVINQVLLDLEKRRASAAERSGVPSHVRALPDNGPRVRWDWIAAGASAVAVLAAFVIWMQRGGPSVPQASAPPPRTGTEVVIEKVVGASAGVTMDADRDDPARAPAFRLSMELSNPPEPAAPIASSRLIGRVGAESVAAPGAQPRAAPAAKENSPAITKTTPAATAKGEIHKQVRQLTGAELAENEYRKATGLLNQGRAAEAQQGFEATLRLHPEYHPARQALVGMLLEARKYGDAERVLQEGLALAPAQIGFAATLARLEVDRGDTVKAIATLKQGLDYAQNSADYRAFLAALLQRQGQHEEAVEQFQAALRLKPALGVWWLGLGMSLQAVNRTADAQEAYRRARSAPNIHPELAALADQRLRQLQ